MIGNDLLTQSVVVVEKREATKKNRRRGAARPVAILDIFITDKKKRTTGWFSVALTLPRAR
jgi:hypothetical protein